MEIRSFSIVYKCKNTTLFSNFSVIFDLFRHSPLNMINTVEFAIHYVK